MSGVESVSGEAIRRAREAMRWTTGDLARRLGVSRQAVYAWEVGESKPTGDNVRKLRNVLSPALVRHEIKIVKPITGLKALRERAGLNQTELSERSHVARGTITAYENGLRDSENFNLGNALKIASSLGVRDVRALMPQVDAVSAHVPVDDRSKPGFAARCDSVGLSGAVLARELRVTTATTTSWRNEGIQSDVPERAWRFLTVLEDDRDHRVRECLGEANRWSQAHAGSAGVASVSYWRGEADFRATGDPNVLDYRVADATARACAFMLMMMGWAVEWSYPSERTSLWSFGE